MLSKTVQATLLCFLIIRRSLVPVCLEGVSILVFPKVLAQLPEARQGARIEICKYIYIYTSCITVPESQLTKAQKFNLLQGCLT